MQEFSLDIKAEEGFARMKGAHRPIRRSQDSCLSDVHDVGGRLYGEDIL